MRPGVGNGRRVLLTAEKGRIFMRLNHVHTICASDKACIEAVSEARNIQSSCSGFGFQVILLGPHLPDNPVSRFLD